MNLSIIKTNDGTDTLFSEAFQSTYHSTHGSFQESQTVFIDSGLVYLREQGLDEIQILEIGFGSGLNALLSLHFFYENKVSISYIGIEKYPISMDVAAQLNYTNIVPWSDYAHVFSSMHEQNFFSLSDESLGFTFKKIIADFHDFNIANQFDVIFFDAFAPNTQPEFWEATFLHKMFLALRSGGVLVTYCAKGTFKRALKEVGFHVESLPGPKGKREMTRAHKPKS